MQGIEPRTFIVDKLENVQQGLKPKDNSLVLDALTSLAQQP